jgi:hypothetical protein
LTFSGFSFAVPTQIALQRAKYSLTPAFRIPSDIVQPRTFEQLERYGFDDLLMPPQSAE